jgi:hypothetical protein
MAQCDIGIAEKFYALSVEDRLTRIIETCFPAWCAHLNTGVSLVYDDSCVMILEQTLNILGLTRQDLGPGGFEIFATRQPPLPDFGLGAFNPDAGGLSIEKKGGQKNSEKERFLLLFESAMKAMTTEDSKLEPASLLPSDAAARNEIETSFEQVFAAQFRFWPNDADGYQSRYDAFKTALSATPDVTIVEREFIVPLREKQRFRRKATDPSQWQETKVTAIAIGRAT